MIPHQYRTVAFTDVDVPLEEVSLRELLMSRQIYRRTRYVIARHAGDHAVVEVTSASDVDLFCDVVDVRLLAGPDETVYVERPDVDTAVPSQLVRVADSLDPGARCVIVRGRYEHVNFVLDSEVRRVKVLDVAPPHPAKLVDQVERLLDTADALPATRCIPQVIDLENLARSAPAEHYLLPCRGGGITVGDATISYLDEVPPAANWVLLGCARSRAIHDHFYPEVDDLRQIDICPVTLARALPLPPGEARLTKCCLLEDHVETRGDTVVVPWGASFTLVAEGLARASELARSRSAETRSESPA